MVLNVTTQAGDPLGQWPVLVPQVGEERLWREVRPSIEDDDELHHGIQGPTSAGLPRRASRASRRTSRPSRLASPIRPWLWARQAATIWRLYCSSAPYLFLFGMLIPDWKSLVGSYWILSRRGERLRSLEYTTLETVVLSPLPCWEHLLPEEYRERIRDWCKRWKKKPRRTGRGQGFRPRSRRHPDQDPQHRPEKIAKSPAPFVHAASKPLYVDRQLRGSRREASHSPREASPSAPKASRLPRKANLSPPGGAVRFGRGAAWRPAFASRLVSRETPTRRSRRQLPGRLLPAGPAFRPRIEGDVGQHPDVRR
jgi:hypothetical protein